MRALFIERTADGLLDLAIRAKAAGHDVSYHLSTYDQHKQPVGRGLVERCHDWRAAMRWADLVILGGNDWAMTEFERWRKEGVAIVGGTTASAAWESDRATGMAVFKRAGIAVPPFREFTDYDSAIAYVKRQDRPFVSKPSGHCDDKALSYVAKSPADLVYMLERWKRNGKRTGLEFILQEKVKGTEFAVGAWFGTDGWAGGWEENFEHKRLFAGDVGPNTGELGTVMRYVSTSKLANKVLKPLEDQLHRIGFVGNIDVNCIIDEDGTPWPLEFTMRCGWPSMNIETELFAVDFCEFFAGLAAGKVPRNHHRMDEIAIGLVLAIPDWPYSHATRKEVVGVPIYGLDQRVIEHVHFAAAMAGEAPVSDGGEIVRLPCYVTAGDYVAVVCGTGDTVQSARRMAYRNIERIEMPSSPFYRIDIGARLAKDIDELNRHGFAARMRFS
jgi:phosphoribosylamine--glycine ligase